MMPSFLPTALLSQYVHSLTYNPAPKMVRRIVHAVRKRPLFLSLASRPEKVSLRSGSRKA